VLDGFVVVDFDGLELGAEFGGRGEGGHFGNVVKALGVIMFGR